MSTFPLPANLLLQFAIWQHSTLLTRDKPSLKNEPKGPYLRHRATVSSVGATSSLHMGSLICPLVKVLTDLLCLCYLFCLLVLRSPFSDTSASTAMTFPIQIHYGTLADSYVPSDALNARMTGHVMTNQELPLLKFMEQAHGPAEVTSVIPMMSTSMIMAKRSISLMETRMAC